MAINPVHFAAVAAHNPAPIPRATISTKDELIECADRLGSLERQDISALKELFASEKLDPVLAQVEASFVAIREAQERLRLQEDPQVNRFISNVNLREIKSRLEFAYVTVLMEQTLGSIEHLMNAPSGVRTPAEQRASIVASFTNARATLMEITSRSESGDVQLSHPMAQTLQGFARQAKKLETAAKELGLLPDDFTIDVRPFVTNPEVFAALDDLKQIQREIIFGRPADLESVLRSISALPYSNLEIIYISVSMGRTLEFSNIIWLLIRELESQGLIEAAPHVRALPDFIDKDLIPIFRQLEGIDNFADLNAERQAALREKIEALPVAKRNKLHGYIWELAGRPAGADFGRDNIVTDLNRTRAAIECLSMELNNFSREDINRYVAGFIEAEAVRRPEEARLAQNRADLVQLRAFQEMLLSALKLGEPTVSARGELLAAHDRLSAPLREELFDSMMIDERDPTARENLFSSAQNVGIYESAVRGLIIRKKRDLPIDPRARAMPAYSAMEDEDNPSNEHLLVALRPLLVAAAERQAAAGAIAAFPAPALAMPMAAVRAAPAAPSPRDGGAAAAFPAPDLTPMGIAIWNSLRSAGAFAAPAAPIPRAAAAPAAPSPRGGGAAAAFSASDLTIPMAAASWDDLIFAPAAPSPRDGGAVAAFSAPDLTTSMGVDRFDDLIFGPAAPSPRGGGAAAAFEVLSETERRYAALDHMDRIYRGLRSLFPLERMGAEELEVAKSFIRADIEGCGLGLGNLVKEMVWELAGRPNADDFGNKELVSDFVRTYYAVEAALQIFSENLEGEARNEAIEARKACLLAGEAGLVDEGAHRAEVSAAATVLTPIGRLEELASKIMGALITGLSDSTPEEQERVLNGFIDQALAEGLDREFIDRLDGKIYEAAKRLDASIDGDHWGSINRCKDAARLADAIYELITEL